MTYFETLLERLQTKTARIGVIGAGYVGLPLAVGFAEAGLHVTLVDLNVEKIRVLCEGESYIPDVTSEQVMALVQSGHLRPTTDYSLLAQSDAVSICVQTPLDVNREPDLTYIRAALQTLSPHLHAGMLVVLESTTYPGTTVEHVVPMVQAREFLIGIEIFVAFSGERIDPGNTQYGLRNTPKVIGGVTAACGQLTETLYKHAIDRVVPVSSPTAAEMVKLVENSFRLVNISFANEVAMMCGRLGINAREVINAAATKPFGFMPFYPGPGAGGHCIPVDPIYLSWKMRTLNYSARFIDLASEINHTMPHYVVERITEALNEDEKAVKRSRILLLGVAYKPDIDDMRESPALPIIDLLRHKGADVSYHDFYVPLLRMEDGTTLTSAPYTDALLEQADCVVVLTNHRQYDWSHVVEHSRLIVDTRNVTNNASGQARIVGL